MHKASSTFGITLSNVPLINLRWEFRAHYTVVCEPGFMYEADGRVSAILTPYLHWVGMPDAGASLLAQRAISGIESYICAAVQDHAAANRKLTSDVSRACANPFGLPGRKTAHKYYNALPALIDAAIAMESCDSALWLRTLAFYDEIRNPLFHGHEFSSNGSSNGVIAVFEHIAEMYRWIDSWYDAERVWPGAAASFRV